ncbi:MAG: D-alanine--D-alanine ligase [Rhodoglobus sp.]|nr:D-alanine--D-alanine ligase [Rhodoglobus sp.]
MIRVGVLFGGANSEHDVSCASAAAVAEALDRSRFDVVLIGIDRTGSWHRVDSVGQLDVAAGGSRHPNLADLDVAFPVLHGRFGEDGTVQGLLELADVPYVGCGVLASALAMDKRMASRVLSAAGVPTVQTLSVTRDSRYEAIGKAALLGFPLFVKPNRAGSSVGAGRVDVASQLMPAVDEALAEDWRALLQPVIDGEEVDVGILQLPDGRLIAGAPLRVHPAAGNPFFDFAAKYTAGGAEFEVPAALAPATAARVIEMAERAFRALGCVGLARVDFFLRADGEIVLNEINTMPGLTARSQYPRMFGAIGMSFPVLLSAVVDTAVAGYETVTGDAARFGGFARVAAVRGGSS